MKSLKLHILVLLFLSMHIMAFSQNASMLPDSVMTEQRLNYRKLVVRLSGSETFKDPPQLTISDFTLVNPPPGLGLNSIVGKTSKQASLVLQFHGPDFDIDYTDLYVLISYTALTISTTDQATNTDTVYAFVENPYAAFLQDSLLTEARLDYRTITVNLTEERFKYGVIVNKSNFALVNAPPGLSIYSVTQPSSMQAILDLQFDGTDFDIDYPYFAIDINSSVLYSTNSGYLRTDSTIVYAFAFENPRATLTPDSTLTEQRLDYRSLTIDLTEEKFVDYTTLKISDFILMNSPSGVVIELINGTSPASADILLQFYGDFDIDYPNFYIAIKEAVLIQTASGTLNTNSLNIDSYTENPTAVLSEDSILTEQRLDYRKLTITLSEEEFQKDSILRTSHFILNNKPAGLTVGSTFQLNRKQALLDLSFNGTDFDANITNFSVSVSKNILLQSKITNLQTNNLTIFAYIENPSCTIDPDSALAEHKLNVQSLTVTLIDASFINYTTLVPANFTLLNAPPGLTIEAVAGTSSKTAQIELAFSYTDFDSDYPNLKLLINKAVLISTSNSDLTSNGLIIKALVEVPAAALSADSLLTEYRIGARTLTINLTQEEFRNYTTLAPSNFVLINYPAGLSIQSVTGKSPTRVEIELQYNWSDFDANILNFAVDISSSILIQTKTVYLRTSQLPIYAYVENPVATLSADSVLTEHRLDYRTLTINLTEEKYKNYSTLQITNFTLVNKPSGLSIQSVTGISPVRADLALQFDGTDFDMNITNFRVDISYTVLVQTTSGKLSSSQITILAYVETPQSTLTADSVLTERRLDYRTLTIDLKEEKFKDYTTLQSSDFVLVNKPVGLTVEYVTGISAIEAQINLQFNGTDYDTDYPNFYVNIPYTALVQTNSGYLSTSQLNIDSYTENPVATLTADSVLTEKRLDYRTLTIDLTDEKFKDYTTLKISDFSLVNAPAGLSIESINPVSPVKVHIALKFDGTDFAVNITDFHVAIPSTVIMQTPSGNLSTGSLTIFASTSDPDAILTADSVLTEYRLDSRTLYIDLSGVEFIDYKTLTVSDFALVNYPAGLSIKSVTGNSPYKATLNLQFIYNDFDTNIPDFHVDINALVLTLSGSEIEFLSTSNLAILAYIEKPIGTLTADSVLTEPRLDARILTINLTDDEFVDYTSLKVSDFALANAPVGLSIESVTGISKRQAELDLHFDGTDFDVTITNFYIRISKDILVQSQADLQTNSLTILEYIEQPVALLTPDSTLTEYRLDYRLLNIDLTEESFKDYTTLVIADFTLNNAPVGLTIQSVQGISPTRAILALSFDYHDFDADITNFFVTINHTRLVQSTTNLNTSSRTLYAYLEIPVLLAVPDSIMHEYTLDLRSINLGLTDEKFLDYTNLEISDFYLVNAPPGLIIESVTGLNPVTADLELAYGGADFDENITNMKVGILKDILLQSKTSDLLSNNLTVVSYLEHPVCAISEDSVLHELTLGRRFLNLNLTEENFIDYQAIVLLNFQLINGPAGLTIESISGISPTQAKINLDFNGTDFDVNYPNFAVKISESILFQSAADLTSNSITIYARTEIPEALIAYDSVLYEYRLNFRTLYLTLLDERFTNQGSVTPDKFTLINAPAGLSIENLTYINKQRVNIALAFNGTDFDTDFTNFRISIREDILVQSNVDLLSNALTIYANIEPIIQSVSIPNVFMKSGDQVIATIKVENDRGYAFILKSGTIGGYPFTNLLRLDNTTYTAVFVITEGGNDYQENENIPVSNLRLFNGKIPGNTWNQPIIQNNDLLDANTPEIVSVSAISGGRQKIGSTIILLLAANEADYIFANTSKVNNIAFTDPSITVTDLETGAYYINYLVDEGDLNVVAGALTISIILSDRAGNTCAPYTTLGPNNISIDAVRPLITRAYISSTDMNVNVGEIVEITVLTDHSGYSVSPLTRVNNVSVVDSNLVFSDIGNGKYKLLYTVEADEGSVPAGMLTIRIILVDSYGNESLEFTSLDPNNLAIYTSKPSAAISGTTSICAGDSARLTIIFGGLAPWEVKLFDGANTWIISDIYEASWQFYVSPSITTTYTVKKVTDATGNTNTGIGSAKITVNSLPVVEIINLLESYDVDGDPVILEGLPSGGTFTGPGVSSDKPHIFYPSVAGIENSPHRIIYFYTNLNGCTNRDTAMVNVIRATGTITYEKPVACFNDTSFIITGSNISNTIGQFSIQPDVPGALINSGNNSATLNPSLLNITETITAIVTYTYPDASGLLLNLKRTLKVEKLDNARITPLADIQFCNNENPVALYGNYPDKGIFTGSGVTGNVTEGFKFNPRLAGTGLNSIHYTYESNNGCTVSDSTILINYSTPVARFSVGSACIVNTGGVVQFINESDTVPGDQNTWSWNFGDPISGSNNFSTKTEPSHFYSQTGQKSVSLIVSNEKGCSDSEVNLITLRPNPEADFTWSGECLTGDAIVFTGTEKLFNDDLISHRKWQFYDTAGNLSDTFSQEQILYDFDFPATYRIGYLVVTNSGCLDSTEKQITLKPTFNIADGSYYQDFETTVEGWSTLPLSTGGRNSWHWGQVNSGHFPYNAPSGSNAWYTVLPQPEMVENSAVMSPCFNFEGVGRPLLTLDIRRSMDRDREGAVIQYTADNGSTWKNVGKVDNGGLNWFNSSRITNGPAGQSTGWTGTASGGEDADWLTAIHHLDDLINKKDIRFRIVYGSRGDNTIRNEGFAFDNFRIGQRSKMLVMEYFTNANDYACVNSDGLVNTLADNLYKDVFDIQYHTSFPSSDRMYTDNPTPSSARGLYYGVSDVPFLVLDGGGFDAVTNHEKTFDFASHTPDSIDILNRALTDPDFNIDLQIDQLLPVIQLTVTIEALKDIPLKELTLHTVILEVLIDDPLYVGSNGVTQFESVARMMLPDAGGKSFTRTWAKGSSEELTIQWNEPFDYLNEDNIAIVVFLQDYNTKEILQAAGYSSEEHATSSHGITGKTGPAVIIYPNPAKDLITVDLGTTPEKPVLFRLYDISGKCIIEQQIPALQKETILNLEELKHGLYIIEIRKKSSFEVIHHGKIILN